MHIGLTVPSFLDRDDQFSVIEFADDRGIHTVFLGEGAGRSNVLVDVALAADRTSAVRLGVGIVNVYTRSPSLIAQSAARLDGLTGGRIVLGLGTSTKPLIEGLHGIPFDQPVSRTSEYIDILRQAWRGDPLEYDGRFFSPSGGRLPATPVQERVPIANAALGPTNRRLTGHKADIWIPHLAPRSSLQDFLDELRAAGDSSSTPQVAPYVPTFVASDLDTARQRVREHIAQYVGVATVYRDFVANAGHEAVANRVYDAWQAGDRDDATAVIPDEMVDDIGIAVTPDMSDAAVSRWGAAGTDMITLHFPRGTEVADIQTAIETFV